MKRLLIVGATGVIGGLMCRLAARLLPDVRVVEGSRRGGTRGREGLVVDVRDADSVRRALDGVDAVINAVGPFDYDPAPLVRSCLDAGCHYVDIAESTSFIASVEREAASGGSAATVHVGSGYSTVPGLIQVFAQSWRGRDDVERMRAYLSLGSRKPVSATLLYCLLRPLGRRSPGGGRFYDRLLVRPFAGTTPRYFGAYPSPFDERGLALDGRSLEASFHVGMDRAVYGYVLAASARVLPLLSDRRLMQVCRAVRPLTPAITRLGTDLGLLCLEALDAEGRVVEEIEVRAPRDGLNVPALPALWAVRALFAGDRAPGGVCSLDRLLSPRQVVEWLEREGFCVRGVAPV